MIISNWFTVFPFIECFRIASCVNVNFVLTLMTAKVLIGRNTRLEGSKLMITVKYLQWTFECSET